MLTMVTLRGPPSNHGRTISARFADLQRFQAGVIWTSPSAIPLGGLSSLLILAFIRCIESSASSSRLFASYRNSNELFTTFNDLGVCAYRSLKGKVFRQFLDFIEFIKKHSIRLLGMLFRVSMRSKRRWVISPYLELLHRILMLLDIRHLLLLGLRILCLH